jgi:hypothetical protein
MINDSDIGTSKKLPRGEAQVEGPDRQSFFSSYYGVLDAIMDPAFFTATKKCKKGGNKWEESLSDLLNQTPAFEMPKTTSLWLPKRARWSSSLMA